MQRTPALKAPVFWYFLSIIFLVPVINGCSEKSHQDTEIQEDDVYDTYRAGVDERLEQLLFAETFTIGKGDSDPDAGKRDWPRLLSEMYKVKNDTARLLEYIHHEGKTLVFSKWAGNFCKPFTMPGLTMYYFTFKELLPEDQKKEIHDTFYTAKKDCLGEHKTGWDYLMRDDHFMDPIYGMTEFNSENFNWMARMAGYLFAHEFQDSERIPYFDSYIQNLVRTLYHRGRLEWNSNNYWGHCFNPLLVLYAHAPDQEVKNLAKAALDWMVLEAAVHYLDGFHAAGDVRAKNTAYKPFSGSVWGYNYVFFATESHAPSYLKDGFDFADHDLKDFTGYLPYIDYYPPQVMVDIANRAFKLPIEIQSAKPFYLVDNDNYNYWKGDHAQSRKFDFETVYQDENMLMVSLASNRPDGSFTHMPAGQREQMPFSEQGMWRLAVKGNDSGAHHIFGNSGAQEDLAGRCPFEQIAQFRNIMVRAVKGTDNSWVAVPAGFTPEEEMGFLFFDLGHGVYAAFAPVNAIGLQTSPYGDENYTIYKWNFDSARIGGTVLETGLERDHTSFANFKKAIQEKALLLIEDDTAITYKSAEGNTLKLQFNSPATYQTYTGEVIHPAGVIPDAWANDKPIPYQEWEVYKTVFGFDAVNQIWGSGVLNLRSAKNELVIRVE